MRPSVAELNARGGYMLQMVEIKCPNCGKMKTHLSFWKKLGNEFYHICDSCLNIPLDEEAYFRIGFHYGHQKHKKELKDFLK